MSHESMIQKKEFSTMISILWNEAIDASLFNIPEYRRFAVLIPIIQLKKP